MKPYQYQILRYVHDAFTGEFVNLGVIVYSPEDLFLQAIVSQKYSRLTGLFPEANGRFIMKMIKNFETSVHHFSEELKSLFRPSESLAVITHSILPPDDSALQLTEVRHAVDTDMNAAIADLFYNMIEKYQDAAAIIPLTDEEVWEKFFKFYFDKYNITERLTTHEIHTRNDVFVFDKSWKNEVWHCYQPVSFDLQSSEVIKNKVYRWSGRLREMDTAQQKIHITFLTALPAHHPHLNEFVMQALQQHAGQVEADIILETEAENTARKIAYQLQLHEDKV
jgi:hypothetical protein